ncbi:MAG: AraC family transcriptional regulator [Alistipes sp.]|nr:AraC family transcriptional regulator [Alistipes sp.]
MEDLSIKEVCHRCHFGNQSQFTSRFKREYGVTPRQYCEQNKVRLISH